MLSKRWHQLGPVLTQYTNLGNVKLIRSYQSADCDTDHSLVCCMMIFKAKRVHHAKKEGRHRINTCMTRKPEKVKEFRVLEEALPCPANTSAAQRWEYLRDTIYNAALLTFGKKQAKTADWFEAHLDEIQPFLDENRRALASYKSSLGERTLQMLRAARNNVQQISRRCANEFWLQLCNHIQICADSGNLKDMYDGIKQAIGPMQSRTTPLKSATGDAIMDKSKQMER